MLRLPGSEDPLNAELPEPIAAALADAISAQRAEITVANAQRNNNFFEEEMEKLDNWSEDVKAGLEKSCVTLTLKSSSAKARAKRLRASMKRCDCNALSKTLKTRRSEKRLNLYKAQDEVDEKKETLLAKVEAMLSQKIAQTKLVTFHWRII